MKSPEYYQEKETEVLTHILINYCRVQVVVAVPATVIAHELHTVEAFDLVLSTVTTVLKSSIPGCKVVQVQVYAFLHEVDKVKIISGKIIFFILVFFKRIITYILFTKLVS